MLIRHAVFSASCVAGVLVSTAALNSQSTRVGAAVKDNAAKPPYIVREFTRTDGEPYGTINANVVVEVKKLLSDLADIAVIEPARKALVGRATPEGVPVSFRVSMVTVDALRVLGIPLATGRDFRASDLDTGSQVAIAAAGAWQRHFARQPLPRVYRNPSDGPSDPVVIIGSLPPGALGVAPELDSVTDLLLLSDNRLAQAAIGDRWFAPLLRLKPGATVAAVQAALDAAVLKAGERSADGQPLAGLRLETLRR